MKDINIDTLRYYLKDHVRLTIDFRKTDQRMGIKPPPIEKPFPRNAQRIDLMPPEQWSNINNISLLSAFTNRKSHRVFKNQPLTLEELSFLL